MPQIVLSPVKKLFILRISVPILKHLQIKGCWNSSLVFSISFSVAELNGRYEEENN